MTNLKATRKAKKGNSYLFKGKRNNKSKLRQWLEAILMLILGINLTIFLNTLPTGFLYERLNEMEITD